MIEMEGEDGGRMAVTFRLPAACGADRACVAGEFNEWSHSADPMERDADGFVARVLIPTGQRYRFRYLLDGERWENDWAAHDYVPNEFGGDDSLLDLTDAAVGSGAAPKQPAAKKGAPKKSADPTKSTALKKAAPKKAAAKKVAQTKESDSVEA